MAVVVDPKVPNPPVLAGAPKGVFWPNMAVGPQKLKKNRKTSA